MPIHPTAIVDSRAQIHESASIGAFSQIGPFVRIDAGAEISSHAVLTGNTHIGSHVRIDSFVALGGRSQDLKAEHIEGQNGLVIGKKTVIREHTSIHVSASPTGCTKIGSHCLVMGQVHIAHDCQIADKAIITQGCCLAGHVEIGFSAVLGGMTGIHQWVRVGDYVMTGGGARIARDIPHYVTCLGTPAKIIKLNELGLQRSEFPQDAILAILETYKMLASGKNSSDTLEYIGHLPNPYAQKIYQFIKNSKRGLSSFELTNKYLSHEVAFQAVNR